MKWNEYVMWNKEIPHKTCKKLIKLGKGKWNRATVSDEETAKNARKSDVIWVQEQWVYDLIWGYMMSANENAGWKYDIVAAESCQVTRYTKDGYYSWHKDGIGSHTEVYNKPNNKFLHDNTRKLSMSIILNSDFEGGDFEMRDKYERVPRLEEGSIIVFPSFMEHRVVPVTKGIRYSLVAWFIGPPFK